MSGFLDALSPDEVAHLHARGVVRRFPRGTALFQEHQASDRVMLLTEGRVKIASTSADGRESVIAFRGRGIRCIVEANSSLAGTSAAAPIAAATPTT